MIYTPMARVLEEIDALLTAETSARTHLYLFLGDVGRGKDEEQALESLAKELEDESLRKHLNGVLRKLELLMVRAGTLSRMTRMILLNEMMNESEVDELTSLMVDEIPF
jgi:hypothetical protein